MKHSSNCTSANSFAPVNELQFLVMEAGVNITGYYKWLHAILRDDIEPQKTLTRILSTINPQERISFLGYLASEYREGVVDELLELRFKYDTANNIEGYEAAEFEGFSPADASYLLLCRSVETLKSLFSSYIPSLLKRYGKTFGTSFTANAPVETEVVYDDSEEYLTTPEAAKFLGVKDDTIHKYVWKGKLIPITLGKNNKYKKSDLKKLYKRGSYKSMELESEMQEEFEQMKKKK